MPPERPKKNWWALIGAPLVFVVAAIFAVSFIPLPYVELAPGKTAADVGTWVEKDMMKGPPPGKPIGGMAAIVNGRTATFPVDLKPGKYGLICFAPDAKDGKSHFAHGMAKTITVAAK